MVDFEDNVGAVRTSRTDRITPNTKHIDVIFHHVIMPLVANNVVGVKNIKNGLSKDRHSKEKAWARQVYFIPPRSAR